MQFRVAGQSYDEDEKSFKTQQEIGPNQHRGSVAHLQIQQGELNNWHQHLQKEAQIYTTAEQTRTQIVTMHNLAYQMSTMPQNLAARYKADFAQWSNLAAPPNTYGNTSQLVNALNFGGLPQASQGYNSAFVQAQSYPSGSHSSLDSLTQAAIANQYATSELAQTTTTSAVATLGTVRSDSQAFSIKLANLEADTFSIDPAQQTENALLGKINSAHCFRFTPSRTPTNYSQLPYSNNSSPKSSRLMRRTARSITPFTSSRTFPTRCRT